MPKHNAGEKTKTIMLFCKCNGVVLWGFFVCVCGGGGSFIS